MKTRPSESVQFSIIARAYNEGEAIRIRMMLDRAKVPYVVWGENMHMTRGFATPAFEPTTFVVDSRYVDQAQEALEEVHHVNLDLPEHCPACDAKTERGKLECPNCGLYLG